MEIKPVELCGTFLSRATIADAVFVANAAEDLCQDLVGNQFNGDINVATFVLHDVSR